MGQDPSILIVDDEDFVRHSVAAYLEDFGFEVSQAENGRVGIDRFREDRPDLLLVDLRMPEVDGLEVLATVAEESPDTPVLIVSGEGELGDAVEALRLGAWDYLVKPIRGMSFLRHAIDKALERARLIVENRAYQEHLEELVRARTAELEAANAELVETRLQIIRRLGKAAEYKDNETGRHVVRVGLFSTILATNLGLDEGQVQLIQHASPMHDIGKIGVPDSILQKPGALASDEWVIMKEHCPKGVELLQPLSEEETAIYRSHTAIGHGILGERDTPLLHMAATIAAGHHERWDGSGYPGGLCGEEIPLPARIVAVADVYDALANRRPYKPALPPEQCEKIITEGAGTHFDPGVVTAFRNTLSEFRDVCSQWAD